MSTKETMKNNKSAPATSSAVLFLDVDGVLNGGKTREKCMGFTGVEQSKCAHIRRILRETGAGSVLSSTWRKRPNMLPYLWKNLGAAVKARHIGNTPVMDSRQENGLWRAVPRGEEIQAWLSMNPQVTRFAILDDDADMCHLTPHLVKTDNRVGVTEEIASEVIRRLNFTTT